MTGAYLISFGELVGESRFLNSWLGSIFFGGGSTGFIVGGWVGP